MKFYNMLCLKRRDVLRSIHNFIWRLRLRNHDFSIISNNCIGGCVSHDFHQRFNSPTVNLSIDFPDYISFLKDLSQYLDQDFTDISDTKYPVKTLQSVPRALLGGSDGVKMYFVHYKTFDEGVAAWKKRAKRIQWNNLYVVLQEIDGCTEQDIREFDALPFKHKVAFVHKFYDGVKCQYVIGGHSHLGYVGNMTVYNGWGYHREYDKFDWPSFLNQK